MPRPIDVSKPLPYTPGPPPVVGSSPEEIVRATWDEFNRIAHYLADPDTAPAVRLRLRGGSPDADLPD
jgi:hypothetical protein